MSPLKSVVFGVFGMEVLDIYYILLSKKPKSGYKWLVAIFQRIGCTLISNCLKIIIRKEKKEKCYGGHGGEKRRAAHVMRGPRICGVASAQGRIAGRVRSSRTQRGERWEPSRR